MAVLLSPVGGVAAQFFTNAGVPLSGGKIYTYAAGTSTPQATYTTGAGNIQHSNPIVLDAAGRVPTGEIWLTDGLSYKFVLKDNNDVLIATYDNIVGINSNFVNFVNQQEIQTATANQTVFTLTTMEYQPGTGNLSVFVDGVNQYGPGAQYAYTETSDTVITFVSGLHVGASVKFTTTQIQNSGVADASQITYTYPAVDAVEQNVEDRLAQYVSVKDFGAVGDGVTDDTDAFENALAAASSVYVPTGTYNVKGLIVPANAKLFGAGKTLTTLRPTSATNTVVRLGAGSQLCDMSVNGNLVATNNVSIEGDYCYISNVHSQFGENGFYNLGYDTWALLDTSTDSNSGSSIYSANRGINVTINNHFSRGNDTFGLVMTYSTQQPQGVLVSQSYFFGNQFGVVISKDCLWFTFDNCVIDGCSNTCVKIGPSAPYTSSGYQFTNSFLSGDLVAANYCFQILPSVTNVNIENCGFGNVNTGVSVSATTTARSESINITNNSIGNCSAQAILVDSVMGCVISGNLFSAAGGATDIASLGTFVGTQYPVIVQNNTFNKANAVNVYNTDCYTNVGYTTKTTGTISLGAGFNSVTVSHGLSRTPTKVLATPQANLGSVWISNITSTQLQINWTTATTGTTVITFLAQAD